MMTENNEKETRLLGINVFEDIPKEKLAEIAQAVQDKVLPANTIIYRQGDPGDSFYIINSGKVRVFKKDKDGLKTELNQLGPGDSFGEMAMLTGKPRSANVETKEETHLSVLTKNQFDLILSDFPDVSRNLIRQISNWLVQDDLRLEREGRRQYQAPRLSWFDFILIIGLSVLFAIVFNQSNPNSISLIPNFLSEEEISTVLPSLAKMTYETGEALLVDARPSNFFDQQHIRGAINVPLSLFEIVYMMELSEVNKEKKMIVYGRSISKHYDEKVANKLIIRGHKNVRVLKGGLSAWQKNGLLVEP